MNELDWKYPGETLPEDESEVLCKTWYPKKNEIIVFKESFKNKFIAEVELWTYIPEVDRNKIK